MTSKVLGVKGMNDILPEYSSHWLYLEEQIRNWLNLYGYNNIRTPIIESTNLFHRSIGEVTDIVEKEMYSFTDNLNGDLLTLRPEGTAGVMRAVIEHNLLYNSSQKLWYTGPMFRHERPQKGRYRQFNQLGVEALGFKGPDIDCEIILMLNHLWQILGLVNIELHINCLGNKSERLSHRQALIDYFEQNLDRLDEEAKRRLHTNPLRILDTKNPMMQDLVENAPKLLEFLGDESILHYTTWKKYLDSNNISYIEDHRLVRGLDYYNLSVFEWISHDLGSQATVCGGGRYDPLFDELGSKPNYGIGFAIGLERLLLILEANDKLNQKNHLDVFIVNDGCGADLIAFKLASLLRAANFSVIQNLGGGNFKSQFKKAASLNAKFALVIGESEVQDGTVVVKSMALQEQVIVGRDKIVEYLVKNK